MHSILSFILLGPGVVAIMAGVAFKDHKLPEPQQCVRYFEQRINANNGKIRLIQSDIALKQIYKMVASTTDQQQLIAERASKELNMRLKTHCYGID